MDTIDAGLLCNGLNHLGKGDPILVDRGVGIAAKITDGLKMNPPDVGGIVQAKPNDLSDVMIIYTRYQRRHQHHPQIKFPAVGHGLGF